MNDLYFFEDQAKVREYIDSRLENNEIMQIYNKTRSEIPDETYQELMIFISYNYC